MKIYKYEDFMQKIYWDRNFLESAQDFTESYEKFSLAERVKTLLVLLPWLEDRDKFCCSAQRYNPSKIFF